MDIIAKGSPRERAELFNETAARKGIQAGLIEKDFWVCWTLKRLFSLASLQDKIIFKGGTSLSKAYKVISRFSEDIDITIDRSFFGFSNEKDPARDDHSNKHRRNLLEELTDAAFKYGEEVLRPALHADFEAVLGNDGSQGKAWQITLTKEDDGSPTVNFTYPAGTTLAGVVLPEYIRPSVRIELGARGELWPSTSIGIKPYAAEEFPDLFAAPSCDIKVLEIERTFWEKATILHSEYHRPADKPLSERLSRHYGDLASLAASAFRASSLKRLDLLDAVAKHKALFFRSAWAKYDQAKPGTLRLYPAEHQVAPLRQDFDKTKIMFFGDAPKFEWVLEQLRGLEDEINRG
jgi:hypothetical protein